MITKYYSDILNKYFDSEAECIDAEKEFEESKKIEKKKIDEYKAIKRKLLDEIDSADLEVKKALDDYDKAKAYAAEILEKSNEEAEAILNSAKSKVDAANKNKYDKLIEYTSKYGTYKKTYTNTEDSSKHKPPFRWAWLW